jgi:hypothetical protein
MTIHENDVFGTPKLALSGDKASLNTYPWPEIARSGSGGMIRRRKTICQLSES